MSTKTENLAFEMYQQLEAIRRARKHPIMLQNFEDDLEAYLEGLRDEHASLVESLQSNVALYQDAYENQKTLTRNACVFDRERWDELYQLRSDLKSAEHDREEGHDKLQDATRKLISQSESIRALLRVIKAQQTALSSLQTRSRQQREALSNAAKWLNGEVERLKLDCQEYQRQIRRAEAMAEDHWVQLEQKQELIVSQRKRIDELQDALLFARKPARKPFFGWLFARQSTQAKPLPKKTI
tara:strand:+ start:24669 stop:25391 length:723 start_codon:yes stop_codon:yes gene_type:complete